MKKKTNQKIRGKKKRKTGNKKFSQALIGGAFIALGCGCFAYPNFREWNTQREVEQIIDNFDKTYSQGWIPALPTRLQTLKVRNKMNPKTIKRLMATLQQQRLRSRSSLNPAQVTAQLNRPLAIRTKKMQWMNQPIMVQATQ